MFNGLVYKDIPNICWTKKLLACIGIYNIHWFTFQLNYGKLCLILLTKTTMLFAQSYVGNLRQYKNMFFNV